MSVSLKDGVSFNPTLNKLRQKEIAPSSQQDQQQPSPPRLEEDTFTFQKTLSPSVQQEESAAVSSSQFSTRDRVTFQPSSSASMMATAIPEQTASSPAGHSFIKVEIPYSLEEGQSLPERDKAEVLLEHPKTKVKIPASLIPAHLRGSRQSAVLSSSELVDLMENSKRPLFININPDEPEKPEVERLRINRHGEYFSDPVDSVDLERHPGQSLESFMVRGLQNAFNLFQDKITLEEAAHNPGENPSEKILQHGTDRKFMKKYTGEVSAGKIGKSRFAQEHDQENLFKSKAIPPDKTVSRAIQQQNLYGVIRKNLHLTGKISDEKIQQAIHQEILRQFDELDQLDQRREAFLRQLENSHRPPNNPGVMQPPDSNEPLKNILESPPSGGTPGSLHGWVKADQSSHANDEIMGEASSYSSDSSPRTADYPLIPEEQVNGYKQYAASAYDMVSPFPGEPKRTIKSKEFPEILKKRLEQFPTEYLALQDAVKNGHPKTEQYLSRIQLMEKLFIHPEDRDYARGLTSKDKDALLDVMARRHNKRTDSPGNFSFHTVETGEPSYPVSEIKKEPLSPGISFNIGGGGKFSRASAGSPEIVEEPATPPFTFAPEMQSFRPGTSSEIVEEPNSTSTPEMQSFRQQQVFPHRHRNISEAARPETEITEEHPSQPGLAPLSMKELQKAVAEERWNTLGAALDANAAEAQLKALKKTSLPKWWNALMPQSKARHMAIKETKARLEQIRLAAQHFEAKEKDLEAKIAAHEIHPQYAPLSKKEVQAYEKLRDEIFAQKGQESFHSDMAGVAKHVLDLEDALKSAEARQKQAIIAQRHAINTYESSESGSVEEARAKEARVRANKEQDSAQKAMETISARSRLFDKLFYPDLYEPLQEQREQKLHLKYIHGPSIGPHESQAETNLANQIQEYLFGKPGLRREMTMKAYDGAEKDLVKARSHAKAMLPPQVRTLERPDQPESSRARDIVPLPGVTEEDIQKEMTALQEKAAAEAKEKALAANLDVKTAEAQLKNLKKTPLPKLWNALMPQSRLRHEAIKETRARLAQARIDAQKAEALARRGEDPTESLEFEPLTKSQEEKALERIQARLRRERGWDSDPKAVAQRQQAELEAFVPWARKEGIPEDLWRNR